MYTLGAVIFANQMIRTLVRRSRSKRERENGRSKIPCTDFAIVTLLTILQRLAFKNFVLKINYL